MALPTDGQNANELDEVTEVPAGKELIFFDPTTNAGGIITLENLTKQILNGIASQAFNLDAGQMTILQALNSLNGKSIFNGVKQPGTYSFPIKQNSCMLVVLQTSTPNNTPVYVVSRYYADICIQLLTGGREDAKASVKNEQLVITLGYSSYVIIYSF